MPINPERSRAEEALGNSAERFELAVKGSSDGFWDWPDMSSPVIWWSPGLFRLLGYDDGEIIPPDIQTFEGWLHPEDLESSRDAFRLHLQERKPLELEYRLRTKSGEYRWFHARCQALWNEAGEPVRMSGSIRDITLRKQTEINLSESEERFRRLAEATPDGIAISDGGRVIDANRQLAEMMGLPLSELIGMAIEEFIAPESREIVENNISSNLEVKYEHLARKKDGTVFPVEVHGKSMPSRGRQVRVTAIRDISDRKKAEQALRESEEKFSKVFHSSPDAITISTLTDGKFIAVNEGMQKMFGYTPGELIGKSSSEMAILANPEDRDIIVSKLIREGCITGLEVEGIRKSGERVITEIAGDITTLNGVPCITLIARDITTRKQLEVSRGKEMKMTEDILDSVPGIFYMFDARRKLVRWNKKLVEVMGYSADELANMDATDFTDDVHAEVIQQGFEEVLTKGSSVVEIPLLAREGRKIPYLCNGILKELGGKKYLLGIGLDLSETKRTEEALRASQKNLRALAGRLRSIREEEGTRIAREIHDELGQTLTGINMGLHSLRDELANGGLISQPQSSYASRIESMSKLIEAAIQSVKKISSDLRPIVLDKFGLPAAIEWQIREFEKRTLIQSRFVLPEEPLTIDPELSSAIFRIIQESLTNVARHSGAKKVNVILRKDEDGISLEIQDDGRGMPDHEKSREGCYGLLGMEERALQFNGRMDIHCSPGEGTTVSVKIPYRVPEI